MLFTLFYIFVALSPFPHAFAHIALYHDSMFGLCGNNGQCKNTGQAALPLQGLPFSQWWFHNYLNYPPHPDSIMSLPAGGTKVVELAGNSGFTSVNGNFHAFWPGANKQSDADESVENNPAYWGSKVGNLHTTGLHGVAGCVLAIAYTSDAKQVRPEDFTIFSVQHKCVWQRDTIFEVPADMPPCPNDKCICSWFWIHQSVAGSDQNYMTAFQCKITYTSGQKVSTTAVGKPVPPRNCAGDHTKCIQGPKMAMYWKQKECNNMPEPGHFAPTYGVDYGFKNGAQNDIFQTINHSNWTCPQSKAPGVFKSAAQSIPAAHKRMIKRRAA